MKSLTRQTLKIYWQHATRYKGSLFLLTFGMTAAVASSNYVPLLYKRFLDTVAGGGADVVPDLIKIIILVLVFNILLNVFWRTAHFTSNFFQPRVMSDLLNTCFKSLQYHSYRFFSNNFSGSLVRRVNRFEASFEKVMDNLYWHIGNVSLATLFIIIVLFTRHWTIAVAVIVWALIYVLANYWFSMYKFKYDLEFAQMDSTVTGHLADTVTNNINLKMFSSVERELRGYKRLTQRLFKIRKFNWDLRAKADIVQGLWMVVLEFVVFFYAIRFWQQGLLTIGDFALFQAYLVTLFGHLWDIGNTIQTIFQRLAEAEEMTEILTTPNEVRDIPEAKKLAIKHGEIEFASVGFDYRQGSRVFKNFNLKIKPGEKLALIGPSGGGKSTFVKLLLRFFDIDSGKIMIDRQNIAEVKQDSLRDRIALVPQDPILFHRSLMENIRYALPSASKEEVILAAKKAHAHEFIKNFPKGYSTFVGERGVKLSGGERQRVAIARAILKNAPILVLDEATSSLDSESEALIQDALRELMRGRTTIVIAHRLSTIMQMDRIVVLENGKVTEEGRHEELLKAKQGTYQRLWEIQAGGFA